MLGSPPLPQLVVVRVMTERRKVRKIERMDWVRLGRKLLQKRSAEAGRRQRRVRLNDGGRELCAVDPGLIVVIVLMVAVAFCAAPTRVMLEGRSEHVTYWPGVTGVQLRTTVPV